MTSEIASLEDLMSYMKTSLDIEGFRAYFDQQTARVVVVEESVMKAVEGRGSATADKSGDPDDEEVELAKEIVNDRTGRFLRPPDKSLFDEDHHRAEFVNTIRDPKIAEKLARTLRKNSTFHLFEKSFSSVLYRVGLEEQWYQYLDEARKQFVIEWAKKNNLAYKDDLQGGKAGGEFA